VDRNFGPKKPVFRSTAGLMKPSSGDAERSIHTSVFRWYNAQVMTESTGDRKFKTILEFL